MEAMVRDGLSDSAQYILFQVPFAHDGRPLIAVRMDGMFGEVNRTIVELVCATVAYTSMADRDLEALVASSDSLTPVSAKDIDARSTMLRLVRSFVRDRMFGSGWRLVDGASLRAWMVGLFSVGAHDELGQIAVRFHLEAIARLLPWGKDDIAALRSDLELLAPLNGRYMELEGGEVDAERVVAYVNALGRVYQKLWRHRNAWARLFGVLPGVENLLRRDEEDSDAMAALLLPDGSTVRMKDVWLSRAKMIEVVFGRGRGDSRLRSPTAKSLVEDERALVKEGHGSSDCEDVEPVLLSDTETMISDSEDIPTRLFLSRVSVLQFRFPLRHDSVASYFRAMAIDVMFVRRRGRTRAVFKRRRREDGEGECD